MKKQSIQDKKKMFSLQGKSQSAFLQTDCRVRSLNFTFVEYITIIISVLRTPIPVKLQVLIALQYGVFLQTGWAATPPPAGWWARSDLSEQDQSRQYLLQAGEDAKHTSQAHTATVHVHHIQEIYCLSGSKFLILTRQRHPSGLSVLVEITFFVINAFVKQQY